MFESFQASVHHFAMLSLKQFSFVMTKEFFIPSYRQVILNHYTHTLRMNKTSKVSSSSGSI